MKMSATMHALLERIPDTPAIKSAFVTTVASAGGSIWAGMAGWNWTSIIAGTTAIAGLGINLYFSVRRDRREWHFKEQENQREQRESEARIAALRAGREA